MFKRYAIYLTLPDGPLAQFGAAWLGWDLAQGRSVTHPSIGLEVEPLTRRPRKYGLHGTIKPPFALARGTTAQGLADATAALCTTTAPITLQGLRLARLGGFLALVPEGDTDALAQLAGTVVKGLDQFRAPPTTAELARRRTAGLTEAQERNLTDWGYPYVLDCFRFHITLTGPLPPETCAGVEATLAAHIGPLLPQPFTVDRLTLCGEDAQGQFHALHNYGLTG